MRTIVNFSVLLLLIMLIGCGGGDEDLPSDRWVLEESVYPIKNEIKSQNSSAETSTFKVVSRTEVVEEDGNSHFYAIIRIGLKSPTGQTKQVLAALKFATSNTNQWSLAQGYQMREFR
ncbi:MAG: hypothetical protein WD335_03515 [Candidatus Paceibacterota bacterium]